MLNRYNKLKAIDEFEQEVIVQVIKRAEVIDNLEQERVGSATFTSLCLFHCMLCHLSRSIGKEADSDRT